MKTLATLLLAILSVSAHAGSIDCPLQGTWKSDAARTLADVAARNAMSPRGKNFMSDDFFGHMIHEWTCTVLRFWLDDQKRPEPVAYQIAERTSDSLLITFPDDPNADLRIIFEGECYKVHQASKGFHEYFCPIQSP